MKKQVICSLFLQYPLIEHTLNGPNQKQTNFSSFRLSQKQNGFLPNRTVKRIKCTRNAAMGKIIGEDEQIILSPHGGKLYNNF